MRDKLVRTFFEKVWNEASRRDFDSNAPAVKSLLDMIIAESEQETNVPDKLNQAQDFAADFAIDCLNFVRALGYAAPGDPEVDHDTFFKV